MKYTYQYNPKTKSTTVRIVGSSAPSLEFQGLFDISNSVTELGGRVMLYKKAVHGQTLYYSAPGILLHDPERDIFQGVHRPMETGIKDGRHNRGFPPSDNRPFRGILPEDPSIIEDAMLKDFNKRLSRKVDGQAMSKEWDLSQDTVSERDRAWVEAQLNAKGMKSARQVLAENKGYHKADIPQGTYGEFSKVEEEFHEAKDALAQGNKVMLAVELSDIILAIKGFVNKHIPGVSLEDLISQAEATERALGSGERRSKGARPSVCNV